MNFAWLKSINDDTTEYDKSIDIIRQFGQAMTEAGQENLKVRQNDGFQILYRKKSYLKYSYQKVICAYFTVLGFKLNKLKDEENNVIIEKDTELANIWNIRHYLFDFVEDSLWEKMYRDMKSEHTPGTENITNNQPKTKQIITNYFEGVKAVESFVDYFVWLQRINIIEK